MSPITLLLGLLVFAYWGMLLGHIFSHHLSLLYHNVLLGNDVVGLLMHYSKTDFFRQGAWVPLCEVPGWLLLEICKFIRDRIHFPSHGDGTVASWLDLSFKESFNIVFLVIFMSFITNELVHGSFIYLLGRSDSRMDFFWCGMVTNAYVVRKPVILVIHVGRNDLSFLQMARLLRLMHCNMERLPIFFFFRSAKGQYW